MPNNIYYRFFDINYMEEASSTRIAADVASSFSSEPVFTPEFLAVITWFGVGRSTPNSTDQSSMLNTFQAVLASDSTGRSFVTLW